MCPGAHSQHVSRVSFFFFSFAVILFKPNRVILKDFLLPMKITQSLFIAEYCPNPLTKPTDGKATILNGGLIYGSTCLGSEGPMAALSGNNCSHVEIQQSNVTLAGIPKTVYNVIFKNPVQSAVQLLLFSFSHNVGDDHVVIISDVIIQAFLKLIRSFDFQTFVFRNFRLRPMPPLKPIAPPPSFSRYRCPPTLPPSTAS